MPTTKKPALPGRAEEKQHTTQTIATPAAAQFDFENILQAVAWHRDRGMVTIPVQYKNKMPLQSAWQNTTDSDVAFESLAKRREPCNIGLLLGTVSGVLDVDLDDDIARRLAPSFLPTTGYRWGRKGNAESHYLYRCPAETLKTAKFQVPDRGMLVELRGDGLQSVIPPSIHVSGEPIKFVAHSEPAEIDYNTLLLAVSRLAAATLLVTKYPVQGGRNDFVLKLSGTLAHARWPVEDAETFIGHVVDASGDDEHDSRITTVRSTFAKHAAGEEVTGLPTLKESIGDSETALLAKWLGLGRTIASSSAMGTETAQQVVEGLVELATKNPQTFVADQLSDARSIATLVELKLKQPALFAGMLVKLKAIAGLSKDEAAELSKAIQAQSRTTRQRQVGAERFYESEGRTFMSVGQDGEAIVLANFTGRIASDITYDDGAEQHRSYEIEVALRDRTVTCRCDAADFAAMNWVAEQCGASAIIEPGASMKDSLRAAIQTLSDSPPQQRYFTCTGWVEDPETGKPCYAHAGGAIGADGLLTTIKTKLDGAMAHYQLPEPPKGDDLRRCFEAFTRLRDVAPRRIMVPLIAGALRGVLGPADFGIFLYGRTGTGKSELSALVTQFYGAGLDARHLPGSFTSTGNALETQAFLAKDALFTIDDFAPKANRRDAQRQQEAADRIIRSVGNSACRARLNANATLKEAKPARCLALMTGEDVPQGHSIRARLLVLEVRQEDIPPEVWKGALTECQAHAREGRFAGLMAAYIQWLAGRREEAMREFQADVSERLGKSVGMELHRRTGKTEAQLIAAYRVFAAFLQERGLLTSDEAEGFVSEAEEALHESVELQSEYQDDVDEVERLFALLKSALAQGRCYLTEFGGDVPARPDLCGYRKGADGEWQSHGDKIGVIKGSELYLIPGAASAVASRAARERDEQFALNEMTISKRLAEGGRLLSTDEARGKNTVRRKIGEDRRAYWHLAASELDVCLPDMFDEDDVEREAA